MLRLRPCTARPRCLFLLLVPLALPAAAQVSQSPAGATLEEVFVSASRSAERAVDLPMAWSSVDADAIDLTAAVHANELMQRVPGAWISRGNGQESLTALRSPVLTGAGGCGPFFMGWDNISLRAPGFCNVNQLFDANIEQAGRVEVIRGPGTSVYGSNAMHGVINLLTAPPTQERQQRVALEAGPFDYYRASYRYSETRGRHGLSVRGNAATDGGFKDDSGFDQQKLTLRHDYAGDLWSVTSALEATNLNQETAGFIEGFRAYKDGNLRRRNPNPEAYRDSWSLRAYSRWRRDMGDTGTLTVTPYLRRNRMVFLQHFLPWQPVETNAHESVGLTIALDSDYGDLQWTRGIDLERTDGSLSEIQAEDFSPNQPRGVHYDYRVDATVAAAHSRLRWRPTASLTVDAGARLEYRRYDYDNRTDDGPACGPDASDCRFFRPADREDDFDDISFSLGASHAVGEQTLLYARAARGFRAPQTAELYRLQSGQRVADLDSERIDSLEAGVRGQLGDGLSWDLTAYAMEKSDVIFQDADRQNVSGAETSHRGLELSLDYRGADGWYAAVDATAARHRYEGETPLLGSGTDISGNDIDTAPRLFGSARIGRELSLWRPGSLELEWVYMDNYYVDPDNRHEYDGHSLFNLRWRGQLSRHWGAGLRITNLTNRDYAERADFGFGQYRYFVGQPRGVYAELAWYPGGR
jgi:outer membrane receptor protein involved in Fe transport